MFCAYYGDPGRYAACFADGWYLTGDLATRDAEVYFWFVGRADPRSSPAGHLIGPFEVESSLNEHAAVAEAAVIGEPDPVVGEVVKAFVVLGPGIEPTAGLERDILAHARGRPGAQIAPEELGVPRELPHTRSGKVMRRLLRARELGLPEGVSMLESADSGWRWRRERLERRADVAESRGGAGGSTARCCASGRFEEKCAELHSAQKICGG